MPLPHSDLDFLPCVLAPPPRLLGRVSFSRRNPSVGSINPLVPGVRPAIIMNAYLTSCTAVNEVHGMIRIRSESDATVDLQPDSHHTEIIGVERPL